MSKNKKNLFIPIFIVISSIIIFLVAFIYAQFYAFFIPWHDSKSYESLSKIDSFEKITINNNGKTLHGWLKKNTSNSPAPLIIYYGGNSENSSHHCYYFEKNNAYQYFEGYNFMYIDYPGYGLSEGNPSDKTMFEAALAIYDYASHLDSVDNDKIIILGYSIGTGVATYVAAHRDVQGLILLAPYDKALNLYNNTIDIFHGPLEHLAILKFDSISYAKNVTTSPLIITSKADEVIDYNLSLNLATYFNKVDNLIILDNNVTHSGYFNQPDVLINIQNYLQNRL